MIRRVLLQQEEVWSEFANNAWPEVWASRQDGRMIYPPDSQSDTLREEIRLSMRPKVRLQKFQQKIAQLDENAERVERFLILELDLKQKHATMRESHATAIMSAAVFGFTIITIIFTPSSFIMSLFALPIDRFQQNQKRSRWTDEAGMYSTNYIGKWTGRTPILPRS